MSRVGEALPLDYETAKLRLLMHGTGTYGAAGEIRQAIQAVEGSA